MGMKRQPPKIWEGTRKRIFERDRGICQSPLAPPLCQGKRGELTLATAHIDHRRSGRFGTNADSNLRVLCRACHVLRDDPRHRGMIGGALRDGIIPPHWRELTWGE